MNMQVSEPGGLVLEARLEGDDSGPQGCHQPTLSDLAFILPKLTVQLKGF